MEDGPIGRRSQDAPGHVAAQLMMDVVVETAQVWAQGHTAAFCRYVTPAVLMGVTWMFTLDSTASDAPGYTEEEVGPVTASCAITNK